MRIILLFLFLLQGTVGRAQPTQPRHREVLQYGFQAGLLGARTSAWEASSLPAGGHRFDNPIVATGQWLGVLIGYHANFYLSYRLTPYLRLVTEPGITVRSFTRHVADASPLRTQYQYIQTPLLLEIDVIPGSGITIGTDVIYLLGGKGYEQFKRVSQSEPVLAGSTVLLGVIGLRGRINPRMEGGLRFGHGIAILNTVKTNSRNQERTTGEGDITQYFQFYVRYSVK